ncbi:MAG: 3-dehydroquinate synthase [Methanomassiliicoccales archaeon PtaU1.Bin124]|nr:MAG: 3-dehydroquinate synthase [Methanomassiliicoccales archaeon PtaU1.Bin124]
MAEKLVWVRSDHLPTYDERKQVVTTALEAGLVDIVVRKEDAGLLKLGRFDAIIISGMDLLVDDKVVGKVIEINRPEDLKKASAWKDKVDFLLIAANDWKVIPLENLIAEFQRSKTDIIAGARTPEEAKLFAETLEVGVDGIAIEPLSPEKIKDFSDLTSGAEGKQELTAVKVSKVKPLGIGDRVCIDTCSLLKVGEGMLIGSQSNCLFLIHSESLESEYVAARPFRVNAGPVHAYVMCSDGRTKYLSEVKAGDELLAVDSAGRTRPVVVGRSKVEVRPLLLIEVETPSHPHTIILQNAETIRLCTKDGSISVTELQPGMDILVKLERGGRHFGHAIEETITER